MNLGQALSKIDKMVAILEKVATIFDFHMFIYLDLTNASNYFCVNYHVSLHLETTCDK